MKYSLKKRASFDHDNQGTPRISVQWFPETDSYICNCDYDDRSVPSEAGFRWNSRGKYWSTDDPTVAFRLVQYADQRTKERLLVTLVPS